MSTDGGSNYNVTKTTTTFLEHFIVKLVVDQQVLSLSKLEMI
jgi:hypothetical protein